jgi:hypothetical protein
MFGVSLSKKHAMRTQEEIIAVVKKIEKLNLDHSNGLMNRAKYLRMHKALVAQAKPKTLSMLMKEFGSKSKKDGVPGYYIYEGVNFTVKFNEASCERTWWEVAYWDDNTLTKEQIEGFEDYNQWDTKGEVLSGLFHMDQNISKNKSN